MHFRTPDVKVTMGNASRVIDKGFLYKVGLTPLMSSSTRLLFLCCFIFKVLFWTLNPELLNRSPEAVSGLQTTFLSVPTL